MENEKNSLLADMASRGPVAIFEKRGEQIDLIEWVNKETGKKMSAVVHKIAAELSGTGQQVTVELQTPRDSTKESVKETTLEKGGFFYGLISSYIISKGVHSCRLAGWVPIGGVKTDYQLGKNSKGAAAVPT